MSCFVDVVMRKKTMQLCKVIYISDVTMSVHLVEVNCNLKSVIHSFIRIEEKTNKDQVSFTVMMHLPLDCSAQSGLKYWI